MLACLLRFKLDTTRSLTGGLVAAIAIAVVAQLGVGFTSVLYRARWRVGSFEEIAALSSTVALTTLIVLLADLTVLDHAVPISAVIGAGAFALVGTAGFRAAWRLSWERRLRPADRAERVIVFGAGSGGEQVITALSSSPNSPFVAVGLLDDDPAKRNLRLRHLTVAGGREALPDLARRVRAAVLVVAVPSATSELIRDLSANAAESGLHMRVLPPVEELLTDHRTVGLSDIRPVTEVDLLGRHQVDIEIETVAGYLSGRRVLVTGAGGSIGSELCRQIRTFSPADIVMLDRDETGLHTAQLSMEGRALLDSRSLVVCDIRDVDALREVFEEHQPEVVFHAAALKHLPLLEMWPAEAVKTNVFGTQNVLRAAVASGVRTFVNISTDKAADPCSILGYTKRICERITASVGKRAEGTYVSVRFGNVLDSRGSVLSTFRAQIEAGIPLTITDPEVTRYFMTIKEAVRLVVQAGAIGRDGEVLILEMGSPVRIAEVADRLAREAPQPVRIIYTGLRPGEKLHEVLFGHNEVDERPFHPLISQTPVHPLDLRMLEGIDTRLPDDELRASLAALAHSPVDEHDRAARGAGGVPASISTADCFLK